MVEIGLKATHIANTVFHVLKSDSTEINKLAFGTGLQMKDGDVNVSFHYCADRLYRYWEDLRTKLSSAAPKPSAAWSSSG
jgi:hypothetical protein